MGRELGRPRHHPRTDGIEVGHAPEEVTPLRDEALEAQVRGEELAVAGAQRDVVDGSSVGESGRSRHDGHPVLRTLGAYRVSITLSTPLRSHGASTSSVPLMCLAPPSDTKPGVFVAVPRLILPVWGFDAHRSLFVNRRTSGSEGNPLL